MGSKRSKELFDIPIDYRFNIANFYPFLNISIFGDSDVITSMRLHDTKSYSNNESEKLIYIATNIEDFTIKKEHVDSNLGIQKIVIESIRANVYYVFTIDFDLLEIYNGVTRAYVNMASVKSIPNKNFYQNKLSSERRGCYDISIEDTFEVGSKILVKLTDGKNVFPNLKTRVSKTNYNAERTQLKLHSNGDSLVELLKIDFNDWVFVKKLNSQTNGIITRTSTSPVGANLYNTGIRTSKILGLNINLFSIYIKFTTPKDAVNGYLFDNGIVSIYFYSDSSLIVYLGGDTILRKFEVDLNSKHEIIVKSEEGIFSLNIDGVVLNTEFIDTNALAVEEYIANIGGYYKYANPQYTFAGIIQSVKVYNDIVDDSMLKSSYVYKTDTMLLYLDALTLFHDIWVDMSGNNNNCKPVFPNVIDVIYETSEDSITNKFPSVARINLFDTSLIIENALLDSSYGKIGNWDPETRGEFAAVAKVPARKGCYYCIINPYYRHIDRVGVISKDGVDVGNAANTNILYTKGLYTIAKAEYVSNPSGVDVGYITFILYRCSNTASTPIETPLVQVYELASLEDAKTIINADYGEDKTLPDNVSINDKILNSKQVSTISTIYKNKSIVVFGDSISANKSWSNYIANAIRCPRVYNVAIGGAHIAGNKANINLVYQIKNSPKSLFSTCYFDGQMNNDGEYIFPIDCVIISMGFNDANNNRTLGKIEDVANINWKNFEPSSDSTSFNSIMQALKYCVFLMKSEIIKQEVSIDGENVVVGLDYRYSKIIFQTPIQSSSEGYGTTPEGDLTQRLVNTEKCIKEFCEYYSIPVICGRTQCGISREEELMYENGKYLVDQIHPNGDGYRKIGEMNLSGLLSNFM